MFPAASLVAFAVALPAVAAAFVAPAHPSPSFIVTAATPSLHLRRNRPAASVLAMSSDGDGSGSQGDVCRGAYLREMAWFAGAVALIQTLRTNAEAVSGGGKDYSGLNLSNQDLSGQSFIGKDFSQAIAEGTNFKGSDLSGTRFYKANLKGADLSGAKMRAASFEAAQLDGVSLKNADASSAYFSGSSLDKVESIENSDFSEALMRQGVNRMLCEREDAKGVNPSTGVDTRESLNCP
mmetsp:Transcript_35758/g.89011  ORF Transcript_35758/g.89011 Transcript_35758/m.89011 type:complete len:237 (-) Transcript_35758:2953-3663(-)